MVNKEKPSKPDLFGNKAQSLWERWVMDMQSRGCHRWVTWSPRELCLLGAAGGTSWCHQDCCP